MTIPATLPGVPYADPPRVAKVAAGLALPPRLIVIHDTSNTASAANEAHYAATRTDPQDKWTSAHFYVDASGPLGSSPLNRQAWAAYSYANQHGWHIEMCGYNAGAAGAVPAAAIAHAAALVARLCALAGIPVVHLGPADVAAGKSGICGHWDVTQGEHVGTHNDPGPSFDWAHFISQVKQGGDDDMTPQELKDTTIAVPANMAPGLGRKPDGTARIADILSFIAINSATTNAGVAELTSAVKALNTTTQGLADAIKAVPTGGVDVKALAADVVDDVAARLEQ